eukprot:gene11018-23016_t
MNPSMIPKPALKSCDETSLSLSWEGFDTSILAEEDTFRVQYKMAAGPWDNLKSLDLPKVSESQQLHDILDVVDLEPGTAYSVRFVVARGEEIIYGPETVFDTQPIGCTPKKKKCIIM